jgi:hypothetical protein
MVYLKSSSDRPRVGLLNRSNTGPRILVKKAPTPSLSSSAVVVGGGASSAPSSTAIAASSDAAEEGTQHVALQCPAPARLIRSSTTASSLFAKGAKVIVQRASFFTGQTVAGGSASLYKPFQRPMLKRRAYGKAQEEALLSSSLGQRRRFDGMQRLLQRAGRGLNAQPLTASGKKPKDGGGSTSEDDSDDEDEEEEAPFEPLLLWTSPHQGGEPKGLPTQTCVTFARSLSFVGAARQLPFLSFRTAELTVIHVSYL